MANGKKNAQYSRSRKTVNVVKSRHFSPCFSLHILLEESRIIPDTEDTISVLQEF